MQCLLFIETDLRKHFDRPGKISDEEIGSENSGQMIERSLLRWHNKRSSTKVARDSLGHLLSLGCTFNSESHSLELRTSTCTSKTSERMKGSDLSSLFAQRRKHIRRERTCCMKDNPAAPILLLFCQIMRENSELTVAHTEKKQLVVFRKQAHVGGQRRSASARQSSFFRSPATDKPPANITGLNESRR